MTLLEIVEHEEQHYQIQQDEDEGKKDAGECVFTALKFSVEK